MGMDASARLVFGVALPHEEYDLDEIDAVIPEGAPLGWVMSGSYEALQVVIVVSGEDYPWAWDYTAKAIELPKEPDVAKIVNAQKLARHLGYLAEGETFGWVLVPFYG